MTQKHVVTIIQRRLTHYRVPLFNALRECLGQAGVSLRLLHGEGTVAEAAKNDAGWIDWAEQLHTNYLADGKLCWQPFAKHVADASLVIITQENAMLANHLALVRKPAPRLAFWGHGANLQGNSHSLRERYKRWSTRRVDWYFAYTSLSEKLVTDSGFPAARITLLNNAIDMAELERDIAALETDDIDRLRTLFRLGGGPVGLFLGSLYDHKRLDMLLTTAQRLRAEIPKFQLLIVGDGPQRPEVEAASERHSWIRYAGALKGRQKAGALKLATINMNPGAVGLGILDSFAASVPIVTSDCGLHGPEIAYLSPDNGVMTRDDLDSYVAACMRLLTNEAELTRLSSGCRASALHYTMPNMVENFAQGVFQALEMPQ